MKNINKIIKILIFAKILKIFKKIIIGLVVIFLVLLGSYLLKPLPLPMDPYALKQFEDLKKMGHKCYNSALAAHSLESKDRYNIVANSINKLLDIAIKVITLNNPLTEETIKIKKHVEKINLEMFDLKCAEKNSIFDVKLKLNFDSISNLINDIRIERAKIRSDNIKNLTNVLEKKKWQVIR